MKTKALIVVVLLFEIAASATSAQNCRRYQDFMGVVGYTNVSGSDVAVSGAYAYVVDGDLHVVDVSNATAPQLVATLETLPCIRRLALVGDLVYATSACDHAGFVVIDVANPLSPRELAYLEIPASMGPMGLQVEGHYAFVASHEGLLVVDVSLPATPRIATHFEVPHPFSVFQAWGIAVENGHAYLAVGADFPNPMERLLVVDVRDPLTPTLVGGLDTPDGATSVALSENFAYVVDRSGLRVVDVTDPRAPTLEASVQTPGSSFLQDVAFANDHVYVVNPESGLLVFDVTDPRTPTRVASIGEGGSLGEAGIDIVGDTAYLIHRTAGLRVLQIRETRRAEPLGDAVSAGVAWDVAVTRERAFVANASRGLQIYAVGEPHGPALLATVETHGVPQAVAAIDNMAYVANGIAGLQIIDHSNPYAPRAVAGLSVPGVAVDVAVFGPTVLIADPHYGLHWVVPRLPVIEATIRTPGIAQGIDVSGDYAYVADGPGGLHVVDLSVEWVPRILGSASSQAVAFDVAVGNGHAYVAAGRDGVHVFDVSEPSLPRLVKVLETPGNASDVAVLDNHVYVAAERAGVLVIDATDPSRPRLLGSIDVPALGIAARGALVYVAAWDQGLRVAPVQCPEVTPIQWDALAARELGDAVEIEWNVRASMTIEAFRIWRAVGDLGDAASYHLLDALAPVERDGLWTFLDEDVRQDTFYWYKVETVLTSGDRTIWGPVGLRTRGPSFRPLVAQPNPSRGRVRADFSVASPSRVTLSVYDVRGQLVRRLLDDRRHTGNHTISWDGNNSDGSRVPAGVYYLQFSNDSTTHTRAITRLR